jgi:sugar phosphate isomerase/epimerase
MSQLKFPDHQRAGKSAELSRRAFLAALPLIPASIRGLTMGGGPSAAAAMAGVQLYTVRASLRRDFDGTLQKVAAIGYREVEFAGYMGKSVKEVRAALDRYELRAPSSHVGFDLLESNWERTVEEARAVGHEWVTVPWIPEERRRTADDYKKVAEFFNRGASVARKAGLRFAYHNHNFEFNRLGDQLPYEILLEETDPSLVEMEMDIYWVVRGGGDPLDLIKRHPGRFTMVHLKDSGGPPDHKMMDVGSGTIDFAGIFAHAREAGIEHAFVEHDEPPDEFASLKASYPLAARLAAMLPDK